MLLVGNDGIIVCAFGIKQINNYGTALVCQGCQNKIPQTGDLATDIYFLTFRHQKDQDQDAIRVDFW